MRYEDVPENVFTMVRELVGEYFPDLAGAKIHVVFDTKKKMSSGQLVLGRIKKANELERFFTSELTTDGEGFDYVIFLDKKAWEVANEEDRYRLLRHELRHTDVKIESKSPYQTRKHTLEDFYSEVRLNQDRPRWAEDLAIRAKIAYENEGNEE